jgi:hypothetical protein
MTQSSTERIAAIKAMRLQKAKHHLEQYAPIWLVDEKPIPAEDAIQFEVVFFHPSYKWVKRRYRYDGFSDVLYQMGQRSIDEDRALEIQEDEPFISAPMINSVDSYGG